MEKDSLPKLTKYARSPRTRDNILIYSGHVGLLFALAGSMIILYLPSGYIMQGVFIRTGSDDTTFVDEYGRQPGIHKLHYMISVSDGNGERGNSIHKRLIGINFDGDILFVAGCVQTLRLYNFNCEVYNSLEMNLFEDMTIWNNLHKQWVSGAVQDFSYGSNVNQTYLQLLGSHANLYDRTRENKLISSFIFIPTERLEDMIQIVNQIHQK